mmetsp:Transcript_23753/g.67138  ORF Transcript_23753/g.67138 Transcript_23753/m.67138 type:complete len:203 (+) Transcript_23753:342-950(+)
MCRRESTRSVSILSSPSMMVFQNVFFSLSNVRIATPPSKLHVDSSARIFSTSCPSAKTCGVPPTIGFFDLTLIDVDVILMSRSLPLNDFGTPMRTLHSSIVCVHLYRGVDPPLPTGICSPSSVRRTSVILPISSLLVLASVLLPSVGFVDFDVDISSIFFVTSFVVVFVADGDDWAGDFAFAAAACFLAMAACRDGARLNGN